MNETAPVWRAFRVLKGKPGVAVTSGALGYICNVGEPLDTENAGGGAAADTRFADDCDVSLPRDLVDVFPDATQSKEGMVAVIDTSSWKVTERIPLGTNPNGIFLRAGS